MSDTYDPVVPWWKILLNISLLILWPLLFIVVIIVRASNDGDSAEFFRGTTFECLAWLLLICISGVMQHVSLKKIYRTWPSEHEPFWTPLWSRISAACWSFKPEQKYALLTTNITAIALWFAAYGETLTEWPYWMQWNMGLHTMLSIALNRNQLVSLPEMEE